MQPAPWSVHALLACPRRLQLQLCNAGRSAASSSRPGARGWSVPAILLTPRRALLHAWSRRSSAFVSPLRACGACQPVSKRSRVLWIAAPPASSREGLPCRCATGTLPRAPVGWCVIVGPCGRRPGSVCGRPPRRGASSARRAPPDQIKPGRGGSCSGPAPACVTPRTTCRQCSCEPHPSSDYTADTVTPRAALPEVPSNRTDAPRSAHL
jgi:hypothetical protein